MDGHSVGALLLLVVVDVVLVKEEAGEDVGEGRERWRVLDHLGLHPKFPTEPARNCMVR
jgi:hypothetical protein